jgi:hypothetical protein
LEELKVTNTGKLVKASDVTPKLAVVLSNVIFLLYFHDESHEALAHHPEVKESVKFPAEVVGSVLETAEYVVTVPVTVPDATPPLQLVCVQVDEAKM